MKALVIPDSLLNPPTFPSIQRTAAEWSKESSRIGIEIGRSEPVLRLGKLLGSDRTYDGRIALASGIWAVTGEYGLSARFDGLPKHLCRAIKKLWTEEGPRTVLEMVEWWIYRRPSYYDPDLYQALLDSLEVLAKIHPKALTMNSEVWKAWSWAIIGNASHESMSQRYGI